MKTLKDADIKNKTVLLRVDFNVNIKEGRVKEDFRIRAVLPTIEYLFQKGARKIVIASHLGRPDGKVELEFSLRPVALHLSSLLGEEAIFILDPPGGAAREEILKSNHKVFLLENLRFYKGEEENNHIFAKNLANLADVFVQEAFGVCHRNHASVVGVPQFLPSYCGLLLEKEIEALSRLVRNPKRPFSVLIGGAKISTKIVVIERFIQVADNVCLGGALANTALKARGMAVGISLVEEDVLTKIEHIDFSDPKLHLPADVKVAKDLYARDGFEVRGVRDVERDEIILDIGPDTQDRFADIIQRSKTVLWNGPMGYLENTQFAEGTRRIASEIARATDHAFTIVGGGDTYQILEELGLMDKVSFVSTGGGAMLDYLAEGTLPGIEALE